MYTKTQQRRLAKIEAKLSARSVHGLVSLAEARVLRNCYCLLDEREKSAARQQVTSEELTKIIFKKLKDIVLPAGKCYGYPEYRRDELRFFKLSRLWRRYDPTLTIESNPLAHADEIEHAFLAAHRVMYEYSAEGIAQRKQGSEVESNGLEEFGIESFFDEPPA